MNRFANRPAPVPGEKKHTGAPQCRRCLFLLCVVLFAGRSRAAELQDMFANRELVTSESDSITGDNLSATIETGEPRHGEHTGGASVWISWVAPTNSIVTFTTSGSSFDTVIAAYYITDGDPVTFDNLHRAARNDDDDDHDSSSAIVFGAVAGERYEIAVDGYRGRRGTIRLSWSIQPVPDIPPIVTSTPNDQALIEGVPLTLSVDLQNPSAYSLQWYLNGRELEEKESNSLYIPSLSPTDLGQYRLRLSLGEIRFFTEPVEIQINSEGLGNSLTRDKVYDTTESADELATPGTKFYKPAGGSLPSDPRVLDGVNRGYNGSQIYNNITATAAPDEPAICANVGAVTWFAYQPPESGTLMLNTENSTVDAAMSVFTFIGALTNISQLDEITCGIPHGNSGHSETECAVVMGSYYVVGIVGVDDSRGIISLNYQLDLTRLPEAPAVAFGGPEITVAAGKPLVLSASAKGSPPLHFEWLKNGTPLPDQASGALSIPAAGPADTGSYSVLVHNQVSMVQSASQAVRILYPPTLKVDANSDRVILSFDTVQQQSYSVDYRDPSDGDVWLPYLGEIPGTGGNVTMTNDPPSSTDAWFRVRVN